MKKRLIFLGALLALTVCVTGPAPVLAGGSKTVICHHNADDPDEPEWVTIEVSDSAVDAHLAHGDLLGACEI